MEPTRPTKPQDQPNSRLRTGELIITASIGAYYAARWASEAGKGIGWDQQNYHFYNVYAWLSGRMDYHIAPAGMHSWLSPILYVPHYWLINHFSPLVAGATFAAWAGLNFGLIYALARLALQNCSRSSAAIIALICGLVGCLDPLFVGELGSTDADGIVSLPVLAGLCAICWAGWHDRSEKQRNVAYASAGVFLGMAAGLKWTCFVYAVAATLALVVLWRVMQMDRRRFLWFAAGGILGYLPAGGYWNWLLWTRYGNPILPFWNDRFHSPWAKAIDFRDMRFIPQTIESAISYPFQWFVGLHPTSEGEFRLATFAFLSILIPLIAAVLLGQAISRPWRNRAARQESSLTVARQPLWFLLTFAVFSYILWMRLFSIQRYLIPLALIAGLLIWLSLDYLIQWKAAKIVAFLILSGFSIYWMQMENQSWRVPYGTTWFGLKIPNEVLTPGTLYIMLGPGPMGYVVPFLPESSRTVRLIDATIPEDGTQTEPARRAAEILGQHAGPMRSLSVAVLTEDDYAYMRRFGLTLDQAACKQFRSDLDQFTSCPITRQAASAIEGTTP